MRVNIIFSFPIGIVGNISENATSNATLCKDLTTSDYLHILWAATAELPGTTEIVTSRGRSTAR